MWFATHIIGGSAEDLHQDVFISAGSLHGLPQLLHGVDDGRVQHGEDGLLKVPRQLALQHIHQLLSQRESLDCDWRKPQKKEGKTDFLDLRMTLTSSYFSKYACLISCRW